MADLIITGWSGADFARIAGHTVPLIAQYAERHGCEWRVCDLRGSRPPSWMKLPNLLAALVAHERVCWIDADVVIREHDANIFDEMPEHAWQGLVEHETNCGPVPNCGVWIVTRAMEPVLEQAWLMERFIHHGWWEQAAILTQMGYTVTDAPTATLDTPTRLHAHTAFLHPAWNHHPHEARRVDAPRFVHVTQYHDRLSAVRAFADQVRP
jgi:hypothetical protein